MANKKSNYYLTKEELTLEIIASKRRHRESNFPRTPAECFTPKLTEYLMLMVNRYANKGQWRGYCVDETTQAMTQRGWLSIDEIGEDDKILSYRNGRLTWSKIRSIYRGDFNGNMFHLTLQGLDAMVTTGHKFVTTDGIKSVELLREKDRLILMGEAVEAPTEKFYSDAFVELVGWVVTEANYNEDTTRSYTRVTVYQNTGDKANRIRSCLNNLGQKFSESPKTNPSGNVNIAFHLTKNICHLITEVAPHKVPTMEFLLSLTSSQRELLIDTMVDGDGHRSNDSRNYTQVNQQQVDALVSLCTMAGYRTHTRLRDPVGYGKQMVNHIRLFSKRLDVAIVEHIDFHDGKGIRTIVGQTKDKYPNFPTIHYRGRVWCPETEYGCFVARRNGCVFLTGNSYIDDMKSDALKVLCENAFKYDETRFDNPFGYYTQIIKYCFITSLEKEEIVRDIKDSLWEQQGMTPSFARQIKNEILDHAREAALSRAEERNKRSGQPGPDGEKTEIAHKTIKSLKKDVEFISEKINRLAKVIKNREANMEIDLEISEILEIDEQPYTGDLNAALSLFTNPPTYKITDGIEIDGQLVNCLTLYDDSTKSKTMRVLSDTDEATITAELCSLALTIRRDLLVKELRDISGHNIVSTRIPTADKMTAPEAGGEITETEYSSYGSGELNPAKRRPPPRRKTP